MSRAGVDAESAILAATAALIGERGLAGVSVDAVAGRAHVGKNGIYRYWPSRRELIAAAVGGLHPRVDPDTGTVAGDLVELLHSQVEVAQRAGASRVGVGLLAEATHDAALFDAVRASAIDPVHGTIERILRRGVERGELRRDLDVEAQADIVHGAMAYRVILAAGDMTRLDEIARRLLRTLIAGMAA